MKTYTDLPPPGTDFQLSARPTIIPHHIDGPVVTFSDGQMHWLTLWERLQFGFGYLDADALQRKRRPNLVRRIANATTAPR